MADSAAAGRAARAAGFATVLASMGPPVPPSRLAAFGQAESVRTMITGGVQNQICTNTRTDNEPLRFLPTARQVRSSHV